MPSPRSLRFAVGTGLVSALALTSGCNKTKQTSNVAPHEEPPHTNVAHQSEPEPSDDENVDVGPQDEPEAETDEPKDEPPTVNVAPQPELQTP